MDPPATLGDLLLALCEMGFSEGQARAAIQAGSLGVQEATDWLLQEQGQRLQVAPPEDPRGAIAAFNRPKVHEVPSGSATPSPQHDLPGPSSPLRPEAEAGHSHRVRVNRRELEEQQREQLAQEVKAERRTKRKEHELVLQRIADDRRNVQAKTQLTHKPVPPAAHGHRMEGRALMASEGQCLLTIRLPSGQALRECFPADCPLQHILQHISTQHPDLPAFTLLQGFPKRHFGTAEVHCSLQTLGLTPSATLCVLATKPQGSGAILSAAYAPASTQPGEGGLQPPRPQALPMEEHVWGRGEILGMMPEQAVAEELQQVLGSPALRMVPENSGVHGLWESTSTPHHCWGQGQRLTPEDPEQEPLTSNGSSMPDTELPPQGSGPGPSLPSPRRGRGRVLAEPQHQWPAEGNRLRTADGGSSSGPLDLPGAVAQAAEQRFHHASQSEEELASPQGCRKPPYLSHVPSLFHIALRVAVTLLTAPNKQYCSSLASLTPPLAEHLLAYMIHERLLRPKTLELFFGCPLQTLVLSCYPFATNELLRRLCAFRSLQHLRLGSCSLLTDQGLAVLGHLQKLQHLDLSACVKLTDGCLRFIAGLPHLSHLSLDQTKVTDCGLADFLRAAPPSLSHLSLNRTAITVRTLRLLPRHTPGLVLLSLKQTEISDFSALRYLRCLHTLHLDSTHVSEASLAALASLPGLSTLTLSGVQSISGDRALQLVSGLPLAQLSLPGRHTVTDSGLPFLCCLQRLLEVDLSDFTHITDEGLRHLPQLNRLRRLLLCNTRVTDSGLQHLCGLQQLEELCLDRTAVSSSGVSHCITRLPLLQVLGLASTPVGDSVVRLGICHCTQLLKVNLSRTRVTDRGLRYLHRVPIAQVNLDGSGVTAAGVASLLAACPSIVSIRASHLQVLAPDQVSDEEPCC